MTMIGQTMRGPLYAAATLLLLLPPIGAADNGADLYADFCQSCHNEDAAGLQQFDGSIDEFQGILEGERDTNMPDFYGVFGPEEVGALYRYITGSEPS
jgi:mono/diheme cytochrome c family protein